VALFVEHLRKVKNHKAHQIPAILTKVASNWIGTGIPCPISEVDTTAKKRIEKAVAATKDEERQRLQEKRDRETRPIPLELRRKIYTDMWEQQLQHYPRADAMDSMGTALAILLGCDTASRGANWVTTNSSEQAVETQDLRFQVGQGEPDANGHYGGYQEVRGHELAQRISRNQHHNHPPTWDDGRVHSLQLDHLLTKTGPVPNITIARRSTVESSLLSDVVTWLMLSQPEKAEPFLTRYGLTKFGKTPSRRAVRSSDISNALKKKAETLGLNPKLFAPKSMRQTGNTEMNITKMNQKSIKARTGHSRLSKVGDKYYNFALSQEEGGRGQSMGAAARNQDGESGFTIEHLKDSLPPSEMGTDHRKKSPPKEQKRQSKKRRSLTATSAYSQKVNHTPKAVRRKRVKNDEQTPTKLNITTTSSEF
jgi:hypothetical protein